MPFSVLFVATASHKNLAKFVHNVKKSIHIINYFFWTFLSFTFKVEYIIQSYFQYIEND